MIARTLECTIERRLLVNYRIEPEVVAPLLPPPFRPQLVSGQAVGGVCFIRLCRFRPGHLPRLPRLTTENVAHRFAVEWGDPGQPRAGVYVPRRDTSSRITSAAGGKVFPGWYQLARFEVSEPGGEVHVNVTSRDGGTQLAVIAAPAGVLASELFGTLDDAVDFFRRGALRLHSGSWAAQPMMVRRMRSSLFDDTMIFPPGTCSLDCALVMRNLPARWASGQPLPRATPAPSEKAAQ